MATYKEIIERLLDFFTKGLDFGVFNDEEIAEYNKIINDYLIILQSGRDE